MLRVGSWAETVVGATLSGALALWVLLSAVHHWPPVQRFVARRDRLQLLPQWSFFAPVPNTADYFLFVRVRAGPHVSPWRELPLGERRRWNACVWNPWRRTRKAFFDLVSVLVRLQGESRAHVVLSLPYLHLLTVATAAVASGPHDALQFALARIIRSDPHGELEVMFASDFHTITPGVADPVLVPFGSD